MEKNSPTDGNGFCQRLLEPTELTQEQAEQVAAGLAQAVAGVNGRCCPTCGLGPVYQLS
jgi:hypothetical protein